MSVFVKYKGIVLLLMYALLAAKGLMLTYNFVRFESRDTTTNCFYFLKKKFHYLKFYSYHIFPITNRICQQLLFYRKL